VSIFEYQNSYFTKRSKFQEFFLPLTSNLMISISKVSTTQQS